VLLKIGLMSRRTCLVSFTCDGSSPVVERPCE